MEMNFVLDNVEFEMSIRWPPGTTWEAILYMKETWTGLVSSAYIGVELSDENG